MIAKETNSRILNFIKEDLQLYIFILFVSILPFTNKYLPYVTFAWVVSATFSIRKVKLKSFRNKILIIFPIVFYLIHIIGLFYSDSMRDGLFNLEKKLSILFIPLAIIFMTDKVKVNYRVILKVFVFANLAASIGCLIYAFYQSTGITEAGNWYFESSHWPTLTEGFSFIKLINYRYSNFSHGFLSIFQHPTYFSTYILFSIVIIVYLIRSSSQKHGHIGYYGMIIYFSIFIWLLTSRAAYLTFLVGLFSFLVIIILKFKRYWTGAIIVGVGIVLSLIALSNKQLRNNVKEVIHLSEGRHINKDSDIRLLLWKSGSEILKENFWFGVGVGDLGMKMSEQFEENNLNIEQKYHIYNPHNQYLTIAITLGFVGLLVLLGWIITTLWITIKRKQFLFFYFMLIMAINLFFESMLNLIAGVSFFVFFYSLLYTIYNSTEKKVRKLNLQSSYPSTIII